MASMLKKALPKHLAEKFVDTVVIADCNKDESIVVKTLSAFIRQEQSESLSAVEMLKQEMNKNGLGVVGTKASIAALQNGHGYADPGKGILLGRAKRSTDQACHTQQV